MYVAGFSAAKSSWTGLVLNDGRFAELIRGTTFSDVLGSIAVARVVGVDVPIGMSQTYRRAADIEAKALLGTRARAIFWTPPADVLAEPTYKEARKKSQTLFGESVSPQSYGLRERIGEVATVVESDDRLREVHPELAFAAMAGTPVPDPKTTWNGAMRRIRLLESAGIRLPDRIAGGGQGTVDDVIDAAAAAWSASRIAAGLARRLPAEPVDGDDGVIWY